MTVEINLANQTSVHVLGSFLRANSFFPAEQPSDFCLNFHPRFGFLQPFALAMLAAWGDYWTLKGVPIRCGNLQASGVAYAWRMGLFHCLGVDYSPGRSHHEEAGRFLPIRRITTTHDVSNFIADVAPLLHRPEHRQAVQYCLSETIRNVLEHAGGVPAFACAQYYRDNDDRPKRVSIGVADYGVGVLASLSRNYNLPSHHESILEAMRPGITGATSGMYGTPDNAGVGLFFLRCIAKFSNSFFALVSGDSAFRLRRVSRVRLFTDPRRDAHDMFDGFPAWKGTVVSIDIGLRRVRSFEATMEAIRAAISAERPKRPSPGVRFT